MFKIWVRNHNSSSWPLRGRASVIAEMPTAKGARAYADWMRNLGQDVEIEYFSEWFMWDDESASWYNWTRREFVRRCRRNSS